MSPKLFRNWEGPYTVVKPINDLVYRIQLGPRTKPKVLHCNRLWCYSGDSPPKWLIQEQEAVHAKPSEVRTSQDDTSQADTS